MLLFLFHFHPHSLLPVTNQSTVHSSLVNSSNKNDSSVTVINAGVDIDCSNHLDDQVKKDNPDHLVVLGDPCYELT